MVVDDNHRFIRYPYWFSPNPSVLRTDDFTEIVGSGRTFARKIGGGVDGALIDLLDDHLVATSGRA